MKPDYIIFTDASVKLVGELNYSAYAAVILNCDTLMYTTVSGPLANRSIVFCEGWAIYQGLRYLKKIQRDTNKKQLKILIVTDSKLTVNTFTVWIKHSWDTSDWYDWKKSDHSSVQNQDLYRKIIGLLDSKKLKVRFVHINSHCKGNTKKEEAIFAKLGEDGVKLSKGTGKIFIEMNDLADQTAHSIVANEYKHPPTLIKLKPKKKKG
jgi:ribonuclease H